MASMRQRLGLLAVSAAAVGGVALGVTPAAMAATSAPASSAVTASFHCEPAHSGWRWQWFDDHDGHHYWRHWEYDRHHDQWYWHDYYRDNQYCQHHH
jgi:Spy/CpxP family protein refolding chaperone